ncbi:MAG: tRNA uracil 4-sulfurtransferase ThiI [Anaerolineae bacterium]
MARHYIIHYGELALKGRNRIHFERRLVSNIRKALRDICDAEVQRFYSYLMVRVPETAPAEEVETRLSKVFGIAYIAPVTVVPQDMHAIEAAAAEIADGVITEQTSFRIRTRRGDKQFPLTSPEVDRRVGSRVVAETRAPVDLESPDVTLNIQIYEDAAYLFVRRIPGARGLPIGSSGRVLVLFSGGIDSPVAAHLMMKRGCKVDFVHFHLLPTRERILDAKIVAMARRLLAPHRTSGRLFMISSAPFEAAMAPLDARVATVVFRRFIVRAAERVARYRRAPALVTGESVGQVASQTLQNISLIARATDLPILRPLVGMDKEEIVELAKEIETFELSIQPYRDPCSLHAQNPATWPRLKEVLDVEKAIQVDSVLEETLSDHVEEIRITFEDENDSTSRPE